MSHVLDNICNWIKGLPFWEQVVFDKILCGEEITDTCGQDILQYLLEDNSLRPKDAKRPEIFLKQSNNRNEILSSNVKLESISGTCHINKLIPDQTITFSPQLTVIYGENGAGKSGYARIFSCAGFSRNKEPVLADVTSSTCSVDTPCVTFTIKSSGASESIVHQLTGQCPELSGFNCFDASSVNIHLSSTNKFSFSPAGLELLSEFAAETDKIRTRLKEIIEEHQKPHTFSRLFGDNSSHITNFISSLSCKTKLKDIEILGTVTDEDLTHIEALEKEIHTLKALNIQNKIAAATQNQADLNRLLTSIRNISLALQDDTVISISNEITAFNSAKDMAARIGSDQFKTEGFKQIGTNAWQQFVVSAKNLAKVEGTDGHPYPQPGDKCILCHQPLTHQALSHFKRLWEFIEGEAQTKLSQAELSIQRRYKTLEMIQFTFFTDESPSNRYLSIHDEGLKSTVVNFVQAYESRKLHLLKCIKNKAQPLLSKLPIDCASLIEKTIQTINSKIEDLKLKNPAEEIKKLESKQIELQHKIIFKQNKDEIETYVRGLIWADRATKAVGSTRHVTQKYNELFQSLVTDEYINRFNKFLGILGRPLNIKIETKPQKGETLRRIILENSPDTSTRIAPSQILSEGEKRAVAISDFMTEVCLDENNCGIILDDPVTSLDLDWRERIAELLVRESKNRQVIVFTHDLPFLYHLNKHAEKYKITAQHHWVKRGDLDGIPGYIFIDNSPALEKDYKSSKKAEEMYRKAKDAPPEIQEAFLKQGFGALRTSYEAFIIFDILNEVVLRFEERVSPGRLKDIVCDTEIMKEIDTKYSFLSKYIEGHLHSDQYVPQNPPLKLLREEIDGFNELRTRLKNLKKTAQPS